MVVRTRALAALSRRCARKGLTHEAMAAELDVSQSTVSRWFSLQSKPDGDTRTLIAREYRIPVAWWSVPVSSSEPSHSETPARSAQWVRARKRVQAVSRGSAVSATLEVSS